MKCRTLFSFIVSIFLSLTAGQAHAIALGDNVKAPHINLFEEDIMPGLNYEQAIPGGALELLSLKRSQMLVPGAGGLYHLNVNQQRYFMTYPYGASPPVVLPALTISTPDVFTATGQLAPGYRDDSLHGWGGAKTGSGIATSGGVRYFVEGAGFEVKNTATGAWVGSGKIQVVDLATKAVRWSKSYVNGAIWINFRRCRVTDIDGDGNDEVVVLRTERVTSTTVRRYLDVFNLATGTAKRPTMTWIE